MVNKCGSAVIALGRQSQRRAAVKCQCTVSSWSSQTGLSANGGFLNRQ